MTSTVRRQAIHLQQLSYKNEKIIFTNIFRFNQTAANKTIFQMHTIEIRL